MQKLIDSIINTFNQTYPAYANEMNVINSKDNMLILSFHDIEAPINVSDSHNYGLECFSEKDLLWINITDVFQHIVAIYEIDNLEHHLSELQSDIKSKLIDLSKKTDIDMNTLWISFQQTINNLENEFKQDYLKPFGPVKYLE